MSQSKTWFLFIGNVNSSADLYDDESAYYSEIGSFQRRKEKEETNMHYASRSVCGNNFYHVVEAGDEPPSLPPMPPVTSKVMGPANSFPEAMPMPSMGPIVRPPSTFKPTQPANPMAIFSIGPTPREPFNARYYANDIPEHSSPPATIAPSKPTTKTAADSVQPAKIEPGYHHLSNSSSSKYVDTYKNNNDR